MQELLKFLSLCEKLRNQPTYELAVELLSETQRLEKAFLMQNLHNLTLPCLIQQIDIVKGSKQDEIKSTLENVVTTILKSTKIVKLSDLKVLLVVLLKQVYDADTNQIKSNISEELKLSTLECLEIALQNFSIDLLTDFYESEVRVLFHISFVCIQFIEKERYRKIKLNAIKCLLSTFQIHDQSDFSDIVLREQIASQIFFILPKILSALLSVVHGEEKLGTELISLSIKAFGRILCLIMEDYDRTAQKINIEIDDFKNLLKNPVNKKTDSEILDVFSKKQSLDNKQKHLSNLKRTSEWLEAASRRLQGIIEGLDKIVGNKEKKIRKELAGAVCDLLENCSRNMHPCSYQLLQLLISLTQDDDTEISEKCRKTLFKSIQSSSYLDVCESILDSHLVKLPRIIYTGSEEEQISGFLLLNGVLDYLSHINLKIILSNQETLQKLVTILLGAIELERSLDLLQEEYSLRFVTDDFHTKTPWKQFKHLRSNKIEQIIGRICSKIGKSNIFLNYLLDLFHQNDQTCNELIVLLQMTIPHLDEPEDMKSCMEELLLDIHWNLAIQANKNTQIDKPEFGNSYWYEDRTEGLYQSAISIRYTDVRWDNVGEDIISSENDMITINDAKFNVLHICLTLETIGLIACGLKTLFQPYILASLHRVLEKTGSSNNMIHTAGSHALNNIKQALGYHHIAELIHTNSDYIAFFVNISLKKAEQSKSALDILSVVLSYSSLELIPHLENIILTILNECSKSYQAQNMSSFLKVFEIILKGIKSWTSDKDKLPENTSLNIVNNLQTEDELCQKWLNILKTSDEEIQFNDINCDDTEDNQATEENEVSPPEEVQKEELPKHIEMTVNILKKSLKYVSSKNRIEKILALDIFEVGLLIIQDYENELLPLVHSLWYPFVERLIENDPVILRNCFKLLVLLAKIAKDFITSRTSKEVIPHMLRFLSNMSKQKLNQHEYLSFEKTQAFKLCQEMLHGFPNVFIHLKPTEKHFDDFLDVIIPFLDQKHSPILQNDCINCIIELCKYDAPAILVKLLMYKETGMFRKNITLISNNL